MIILRLNACKSITSPARHAQLLAVANLNPQYIPYCFDHSENLSSGFSEGIYRRWPINGSAGGPGGRESFDLDVDARRLSQRTMQMMGINHKMVLIPELECWKSLRGKGLVRITKSYDTIHINIMIRNQEPKRSSYIYVRWLMSRPRISSHLTGWCQGLDLSRCHAAPLWLCH